MPVNLLTEKTDQPGKEKAENLLPELTGLYKDSDGSATLPEKSRREPFIKDVSNAFMAGLSRTWATAARIPAGVYDLAAMPQNFLVKSLGRDDLQVQSPEWLMDNPVAELYDYQTQAFRKEITPTKSFEEAFATKDFDGIGRHLAIQVVENAPQQIGIILSYMAGYPGAGLTGMGLLATTDSLKEGRKNKKDPAMNAYNSLTKGVIEAGFENLGTMGVLKKWSGVLTKSFGTKNAKLIMGDIFKTIFQSMLAEGNEEFWTTLGQDFSDFATGINTNALKGTLVRAFEAGAVGGISGALLTSPTAIKLGHRSASLEKMQREIRQVTETLQKEAERAAEEAPEGAVEEIPAKGGIEAAPMVLTEKSIQPEEDKKTPLEKEIERMKFREDKVEAAQKSIVVGESIHGAIKDTLETIAAEKDIPEIKIGELLSELNAEAGTNFKNVKDLREFEKNWKSEKKWLERIIEEVEPEVIAKKETTILKEKIRNIERGIREGKIQTQKQIKQTQTDVIDIIKQSNLEAADKAKFIPLIKNTQTKEQLAKALPDLNKRIAKLAEKAAKRSIKNKIKKSLESTKIKKVAGKIVGRFTPEGEAVLKNLRKISKMDAETAQDMLDKNMEVIGDQIPTFEQALNNRMLSFMADAENVTVKDMQELLNDIKLIKESGRGTAAAKTFARQTQDAENKQATFDVLTKGEVVPEGTIWQQGIDDQGKTFKEKVNAIRIKFLQLGKTMSGWNDIMDMLSFKDKGSLVGRSILNKIMKVSHIETLEKKVKRIQTEKLVTFTKEVFGFKSEKQLLKQFRADNEVKNLGTFRNTMGQVQEIRLSKAEARKLWMEMQDPTLSETFTEGMFFTQDMMDAVEGFLSEKDKAFAQEQLKFYTEFYNEVNPVYREMYGIDLPFNPFYSSIAREGVSTKGEAVDFLGEMQHRRSIATGNLKARVKNILPLRKQSDMVAIQKHIIEMSHFIAWAEKVRSINAVFKDPVIRTQIRKFHGSAILPIIDKHIETFTTGGKTDVNNFNAIDKLRVNYTTSVLGGVFAGKPALMLKQLVSFIAFADEISVKDFTVGVADFILHPIRSTKILSESEMINARGRNLTRDMSDAIKSQEFQLMSKTPSLKNKLMFMTRFGDMGAILFGGWSVYKSALAKTGSATKAMEAFEDAASSAQQSADLSQLSVWQKGGSFAKLFTMFTTSQNQYFRKEMGAIRGLMTGRGTMSENVKKIILYHFVLPMFFQFVASGFKWDDEEQLRAGILGSFNGVFILKDILDGLIRAAIGLHDYKKAIPIVAHFDKMETAIQKMRADDITDGDIVAAIGDILAAGVGIGTGLPAKDILNKIVGLKELESGEVIKGGKIMLGWSPYTISQGEKKSGKKLIR